MSKTLADYILMVEKDYKYRIKFACDIDEGKLDLLEKLLSKYDLSDVTDIHKTPYQKNPLDFTNLNNVEVYIINVVTKVPVSAGVLAQEIAKFLKIDETVIRVYGEGSPYEQYEKELEAIANKSPIEHKDVNPKDYYGDDYNKDLVDAVLKHGRREVTPNEKKPDSLFKKILKDKASNISPLGSFKPEMTK